MQKALVCYAAEGRKRQESCMEPSTGLQHLRCEEFLHQPRLALSSKGTAPRQRSGSFRSRGRICGLQRDAQDLATHKKLHGHSVAVAQSTHLQRPSCTSEGQRMCKNRQEKAQARQHAAPAAPGLAVFVWSLSLGANLKAQWKQRAQRAHPAATRSFSDLKWNMCSGLQVVG